jgi:hypothetical protein
MKRHGMRIGSRRETHNYLIIKVWKDQDPWFQAETWKIVTTPDFCREHIPFDSRPCLLCRCNKTTLILTYCRKNNSFACWPALGLDNWFRPQHAFLCRTALQSFKSKLVLITGFVIFL